MGCSGSNAMVKEARAAKKGQGMKPGEMPVKKISLKKNLK